MTNLENNLTVDDLIVEYMIYKVNNGYEPSFLASEFIEFLMYFEKNMKVYDKLYDPKELFHRFFERKNENDWFMQPHMDIENINDNDFLIKANYKLSNYDKSVINTYFMDNGMGKFDDYKGEVYRIRGIIKEFLAYDEKRIIDETTKINSLDLKIGKFIACKIIIDIWNNYVDEHIKNGNWPKLCTDINVYLLKIDLAEIIGVESIKNKLLSMYNILSKRIAILYSNDKNLKITNYSSSYLAKANYNLIIKGYEEIFNLTYGNDKPLKIDLSEFTINSHHEIENINNDEIENENIMKLVINLNKR